MPCSGIKKSDTCLAKTDGKIYWIRKDGLYRENMNKDIGMFHKFKKAVIQAILICVAAGTAGLIQNTASRTPLPFTGGWDTFFTVQNEKTDPRVISLDEAAGLHKQKKAVFLDARPRQQYIEGHIKGAFCLPAMEAESAFVEVMEKIPDGSTIICYCDGANCDLSKELADFLEYIGISKVRILENGWTRWKDQGLPAATGESP